MNILRWRKSHDAQFADLPTVQLRPVMDDTDVIAHTHSMYCRDLLEEIALAVVITRAAAPDFPAELSSRLEWMTTLFTDLCHRIDQADAMLARHVAQVAEQ